MEIGIKLIFFVYFHKKISREFIIGVFWHILVGDIENILILRVFVVVSRVKLSTIHNTFDV